MNGGKHFWNRERKIIAALSEHYQIQLVINHSGDLNYRIENIIEFAREYKLQLVVVDFTNRKASSLKGLWKDFQTILKIRTFKPDYIYIESFGSLFFALYSGLFLPVRKVIFAILDYKLHPYGDSVGKVSEKIYQRLYLFYFKRFHLFSSEQARMLSEEHPSKKSYYIKLFLIENDFPKAIPTQERSFEKINFLYFGKIYKYKGVDIFIRATEILAKKRQDFKSTIAGRAKDFSTYQELINTPEIFELKIHYLDTAEIPTIFHEASYFVLPYREVTQSGPLSLAFHFGLCPITSDIGGFKELIVDGENGFTFESENPDSLAEVMNNILEGSEKEHQNNQNRLQDFVKKDYDIQKFVGDYKNMFETLVG